MNLDLKTQIHNLNDYSIQSQESVSDLKVQLKAQKSVNKKLYEIVQITQSTKTEMGKDYKVDWFNRKIF